MAQQRRGDDGGIGAISGVSPRRKRGGIASLPQSASPKANVGTRVDTVAQARMTDVSRGKSVQARQEDKSIWLRDRVTLSLESQLLLLEMRRTNPIDLEAMHYENKIDNLEVKSNVFVQILPFGAYRLCFKGG